MTKIAAWSDDEISQLMRLSHECNGHKAAEILGRKYNGVMTKASNLGIKFKRAHKELNLTEKCRMNFKKIGSRRIYTMRG